MGEEGKGNSVSARTLLLEGEITFSIKGKKGRRGGNDPTSGGKEGSPAGAEEGEGSLYGGGVWLLAKAQCRSIKVFFRGTASSISEEGEESYNSIFIRYRRGLFDLEKISEGKEEGYF